MFNRNKINKTESKCGKNSNELIGKYIHDIRNMKTLDEEIINNIRNFTNEEKMDIIIALNDVVENLKSILDLNPLKRI